MKKNQGFTHKNFLMELKKRNLQMFMELEFLENYKNSNTKIKAKSKYGLVSIRPANLLCHNSKVDITSAINKTSFFIQMAKEIHGEKYSYEKVNYIKNCNDVVIHCKTHSEYFKQTPATHLEGGGCPKCGGVKKISFGEKVSKLEKVRPILFYNLKNIEPAISGSRRSNYFIADDEFGKLRLNFTHMYSGREPSIRSAINKTTYMKNKFLKVHGDTYSYDDFIYNGATDKSIISCRKHGHFKQTPSKHLTGQGCPQCAKENIGWFMKDWLTMSKRSNKFDGYKLYKIRCWNDKEEFYKIGITFKTIADRFRKGNNSLMPYNYEVIEIKESKDGEYIWVLEDEMHDKYKRYSYAPKLKFEGDGECFKSESIREEVIT